MTIDLTQFYQIFFEETAEHLAAMESLLLGLDAAHPSTEDLNAIFRAAHSIKGGAGTFGFNDMAEVTHVMETLLDKLRKQEMALDGGMVGVFLEAGDVISMQLAALRSEGKVDASAVDAVREKLKHLSAGTTGETTSQPTRQPEDDRRAAGYAAPAHPVVQDDPGYGFFDGTTDGAAGQPTDGCQAAGYKPSGDDGKAAGCDGGAAFFPAAEMEALAAPDTSVGRRTTDRVAAHQADASSIRVNVEKVDQLLNLMGELVIAQAMLAQAAQDEGSIGNENLQRSLHQIERNTRDMQEAVMSLRMLPIFFVFGRFPRLVRDLAGKLGKQVEMKMEGEATELDKGLIENISDPLTHLVRNSLDHGIEPSSVRVAAGKNPCGTITLRAFHQGGSVVIEVSDDGAGLNRGRILQKAQERGMPVRDGMSDQEVWALIMEPGFSTAEAVTDLSGRGVGMDVVKRNIAAISGHVELDSAAGLGMRVTIRLPLTLAIVDGLAVSVGQEIYILPLNAIKESLQATAADLRTVSGEGRLLQVRGEYLPLVALHEAFNIQPLTTELSKGIVVIMESGGKKTALFVDALLGQSQVVIKSLESNFRKVQGVSGATIMGDGKVALILDAAALAAHHGQRAKLAA